MIDNLRTKELIRVPVIISTYKILIVNMSLSEYLKDLPAKDKANFTNLPSGDSKNGAARSTYRSKPPVYVPTIDHQPEQVDNKIVWSPKMSFQVIVIPCRLLSPIVQTFC